MTKDKVKAAARSAARALAFAGLFALCAPQGALGQHWPSFRGEGAGGVAPGGGVPTVWNVEASRNIRWRATLPGLGHSSPVIWGDKIFITTAVAAAAPPAFPRALSGEMRPAPDDAAQTWLVRCYEKTSGRLLWERVAHRGRPRSRRHPFNSYATPTAAVDDKHLVVFFGSEGLYCYDLGGKLLWKRDLGVLDTGYHADRDLQWGVGSSPIIYRDLVILQCDIHENSFLAAYHLSDGSDAWRVRRDDAPSWGTPTVCAGARDELITNAPKFVRAYDPLSGAELWRFRWDMEIHESTPTVSGGLIYVSSGKGTRSPVYAIRPGGSGDISPPEGSLSGGQVVWGREKGGPITTTPLVYERRLYALTDMGVLRCLDALTGELLYEQRLGSSFFASPVAADGKLYLASLDGDVYVVRAGPKYELLSVNAVGAACLATPAVSDGMLYIRTLNQLICVAEGGTAAGGRAARRRRKTSAASSPH